MKGLDTVKVSEDYDNVVGVNWAFLLPNVWLNVVCDYRCVEKMLEDERFKSWLCKGGICYFIDHAQQVRRYSGCISVKSTYPNWQTGNPEDGLYCRSHVGLSGLNLATILARADGEDEFDGVYAQVDIYGLDLNETVSGRTENWHAEHDPKWAGHAKTSYPGMLKATAEAQAKIPAHIKVVNKNANSAYRGFEFA